MMKIGLCFFEVKNAGLGWGPDKLPRQYVLREDRLRSFVTEGTDCLRPRGSFFARPFFLRGAYFKLPNNPRTRLLVIVRAAFLAAV